MRNAVALYQGDIKIAGCAARWAVWPPFRARLCGNPYFPIEFLCGIAHIAGMEATSLCERGVAAMVALLVEHLKLVILALLIGSLIGLWHLGGPQATPRRRVVRRRQARLASARH